MIPVITHPSGKYWKQPDIENILVDETHALMTKKDFDQLENYQISLPSGVYEGKMWRCGMVLLWYGPSSDPNKCSINQRKIIIVSLKGRKRNNAANTERQTSSC